MAEDFQAAPHDRRPCVDFPRVLLRESSGYPLSWLQTSPKEAASQATISASSARSHLCSVSDCCFKWKRLNSSSSCQGGCDAEAKNRSLGAMTVTLLCLVESTFVLTLQKTPDFTQSSSRYYQRPRRRGTHKPQWFQSAYSPCIGICSEPITFSGLNDSTTLRPMPIEPRWKWSLRNEVDVNFVGSQLDACRAWLQELSTSTHFSGATEQSQKVQVSAAGNRMLAVQQNV